MPRTARRRRRTRRRWVAVSVSAVLVGGVAGGVYVWQTGETSLRRPVMKRHRVPTFAVPRWSLVASLPQPVPSYAAPTTTSAASILPPAWASQFLAMPVIGTAPGWEEVRVPARPPAPATAWIPAATAETTRTPYYVVVDLGTRRLLLFDQSRLLMCVPAAVGAATTPTPTGHYFVGLLVQPPPADAGTFAVLTSAVIDGITDWEQAGNAMITIATSAVTGTGTTTGSVQLSRADENRLRPVPLGSPIDVVSALNHRLNAKDERLCASRSGIPVSHRHDLAKVLKPDRSQQSRKVGPPAR